MNAKTRIARLHVITDSELQRRWSHVDLARLALEGGAGAIQYRRKSVATRLLLAEAIAIREACRRKKVPLILNDRADLALFCDAEGVHLGDDDLPIPLARDLLGPHRIIGGSADGVEDVAARAREGADYAGIGPVFATASKSDTGTVLGLEGLARAVRAATIPLIAIGGITLENLPEVLATGVHGVAVLSAVCLAEDPAAAVAALRAAMEKRT